MEKSSYLSLLLFISSLVLGSNGRETSDGHSMNIACWRNPVDIVIVLDSSRSIWALDFKKQLEFVKNLVDQLDVGMGATQTRVGVMSFSNWAQIEINLYESTEKEELKRKIDNIRQLQANTNTGDALRLLRNEAFKLEQGSRPWVRHIALILTDGESQNKTTTQFEARACKDSKIELFAIGIGESVSYRELRGIASNPKSKYFILTSDYDALDRIRHDVVKKTCQPVTPKPTTTLSTRASTTTMTTSTTQTTPPMQTMPKENPIAEEACKNKVADIFVLLDSSSSIRIDEFKKQINFIEEIVKKFDIGPFKTRIGVSVFSHEYYSILKFDQTNDKQEILKIIHSIKYLGGGTAIGKALSEMRLNEFNANSARPGVEKIVILFTDGQSTDADQASFEAKKLKESNVKIFVVGIGPFIDQMELEDIASRPSKDFVHTFDSFDDMFAKGGILSRKTCTVDEQIFVREQEVCNASRMTDVMFMVSNNHFGKKKTNRILKAAAEVVRRVGSRGAFNFGVLFDECLPKQAVKIGSIREERQLVNEIVNFRYGSIASLIRQLQIDEFSPWSNVRHAGLLFLDDTVDLQDPQIKMEIKRAVAKGIQFYPVVIGEDVDIDRVENIIAPKERIIFVKSYDDIPSSLPFGFTDNLCKPEVFKPEIS